jgi:hypothetical protein
MILSIGGWCLFSLAPALQVMALVLTAGDGMKLKIRHHNG